MASKAEINRLGDALREGNVTTENLIALDEYRRGFQPAIEEVVQRLLWLTEGAIVQRPSKSTPSIIAKLQRQSTVKLTQIQDIAGLRVLASERMVQKSLAGAIQIRFPTAKLFDRIQQPSFGYRALHLVVTNLGKPIEIQIRTVLQHSWAHLSERLADVHGHAIKYGDGEASIHKLLMRLSDEINTLEQQEFDVYINEAASQALDSFHNIDLQRQTLLDRIQSIDPANPDTN